MKISVGDSPNRTHTHKSAKAADSQLERRITRRGTTTFILQILGIHGVCSAVVNVGAPLTPPKVLPEWQCILSDASNHSVLLLENWTLRSADGVYTNLSATVPGDLLSDLMANGLIDDPYFDRNFLTQRDVWMGQGRNYTSNVSLPSLEIRTRTWIYSTYIPAAPPPSKSPAVSTASNGSFTSSHRRVLVLPGIKLGASVFWKSQQHSVLLTNATDQFLTYIVEVPSSTSTPEMLEVVFDPTIATDGRFMACSGGWDWAPYSQEGDVQGARVLTLGLTQPISLVPVNNFFIRHIIPKTYPLLVGSNVGNFLVRVEVVLEWLVDDVWSSTRRTRSYVPLPLYVYSEWNNSTIRTMLELNTTFAATVLSVDMGAENVELWWPNGLGSQRLYKLRVSSDKETWVERRIGFRSIALITSNTTSHRSDEKHQQGTGSTGMIVAINNQRIWSRGANVIPVDQLEGRWSDEAHVRMVRSAALANMNMIRVWGGGVVLPKSFYDACDEYGILLYHDLMFVAEKEHAATRATETMRREIIEIVRKLSSHPSLILWSGCNECTFYTPDITIYAKFVLTTVVETDDTRIVWPSSPSKYGWTGGVRTADGLPNGKPLQLLNRTGHNVETHGPYQQGISETYPTINGEKANNTYETLIPPKFDFRMPVGIDHQNTFVSEFGASVFSSFESMSVTLQEKDWGVHGSGPPDNCTLREGKNICIGNNVMAERNYACDSRIQAFFGNASLDEIGAKPFQRQLYQCLVSQTIWMKGQIEQYRSENVFGTLIWQLNENFPTGGWGVVEYGPSRGLKQQIVGGRWKPLMYLLSNVLFRDVIVACGQGGECFARNDCIERETVDVVVEAWNLDEHSALRNHSLSLELEAGPGQLRRFQLSEDFYNDVDLVILTYGEVESVVLWKTPQLLRRVFGGVIHVNVTGDSTGASVLLESNYLALYVVLATKVDGVFADNSFLLRPGATKIVRFDPITADDSIDMDAFENSLRVETLCDYCGFNLEQGSAFVASG